MARARNIKPGFFKNEDLGTADPFVSLLFAGLWMLADKDGILEDRPLRIKAEIFPYRDGLEVNGYLTQLVSFGLVHRYEVEGVRYIQIVKFAEHQHPHHTEKPSNYPSYSYSCKLTVKEQVVNSGTPSDLLITDSLIPDSSNSGGNSNVVGAQQAVRPAKGHQLPKDWVLPKSWGEWALDERPDMTADDVRREAEKFRDHWHANANQRNGKKSDWYAAWRNWIRGAKVIKPDKPGFNTVQSERLDMANKHFRRDSSEKRGQVIDITSFGKVEPDGAGDAGACAVIREPVLCEMAGDKPG